VGNPCIGWTFMRLGIPPTALETEFIPCAGSDIVGMPPAGGRCLVVGGMTSGGGGSGSWFKLAFGIGGKGGCCEFKLGFLSWANPRPSKEAGMFCVVTAGLDPSIRPVILGGLTIGPEFAPTCDGGKKFVGNGRLGSCPRPPRDGEVPCVAFVKEVPGCLEVKSGA